MSGARGVAEVYQAQWTAHLKSAVNRPARRARRARRALPALPSPAAPSPPAAPAAPSPPAAVLSGGGAVGTPREMP